MLKTVVAGLLVAVLSMGCTQTQKTAVRKDRSARQQEALQRADQAFDELDREFEPAKPRAGAAPAPSREAPATKVPTEGRQEPVKETAVIDTDSPRYLKATGIGQTDGEARRMAKAELANIFQSKIQSQVLSNTQALTDGTGKQNLQKKVEADIRVLSAVELKGVEIGKSWYDEKSRSYYAEAVLDREKASREWLDQIEKGNMKIDAELSRYRGQKSPLMKLQAVKSIMAVWLENEMLASRLRVIGYPHEDSRNATVKELLAATSQLKDRMRLWVDVTGPNQSDVKDQIEAALTAQGFKLTSNRKAADVAVTGHVKVAPVNLNNPDFRFARATVSLTLTDVASGAQVGEVTEKSRKGHIAYEEAARRAVKDASQAASEKLMAQFEI